MKKSELLKEYNRLKAEELQREREKCKPFRIFQDLEKGIRIVEGKGKEFKIIIDYEFEGYNKYGQPIFNQAALYTNSQNF